LTVDGIVIVFEHHRKQVEEHRKKGIIYGSASVTDLDLMLDEIERRLDNGENFEEFLIEMEKEGYDDPIGTFEEEELI